MLRRSGTNSSDIRYEEKKETMEKNEGTIIVFGALSGGFHKLIRFPIK